MKPNRTSSMRWSRLTPRILAGVVAFLALGGPSPGHVGSCDGSAEAADPDTFCEYYRTWECAREAASGRIADQEAYRECTRRSGTNGPYAYCVGFTFTCEPTQGMADACIRALERTDPSVPTADIPQCNFCGGV